MNNQNEDIKSEDPSAQKKFSKKQIQQLVLLGAIGAFVLFIQLFEIKIDAKPFLKNRLISAPRLGQDGNNSEKNLEESVLPADGTTLPIKWGSFGSRMIAAGAIDKDKFESLYKSRGGMGEYEKNLLSGETDGNLKITPENSGVILNLLWAFGLGNKNPILEKGPMQDSRYDGAGRFASTGGWTLAKGNAMDHYSAHSFIVLNQEQQALVEKVSKNIYRPCCGNSTYFPDCNHGMAMLALLELMAWQGVGEEEMYKTALQINSYWFPDTYVTIAKYFEKRGVAWKDVDPKTVLGSAYSSASGYQGILSEIEPPQNSGGGGCGA